MANAKNVFLIMVVGGGGLTIAYYGGIILGNTKVRLTGKEVV